ncbi:hypothetical protein [Pontibacter anaerobius]|uniref:Vitellogenin II n=1 Tax=Pontibacter anaerobius TaxID=2993940 RepID=A0ABT3RF17_9BACT|nr:hypothetical protein [Pontibacter anaerobius]MCX2740429.1 hypothetical protein [Pontibacter anaerobius]
MKKYTLFTVAPVLALLAVGCSSPVAMQSSEYDDMYYSSSDQTVYVEPAAQQPAQAYQQYENRSEEAALAEGEVLNPEYSESNITQNYSGDEYYDGRAYDARDNWYRPDYSYVDPYWGSAYVPRRTSYAFYDPFYDPFYYDPFYYDPFWNNARFRTGVSISFSYGWGNGFYGSPYYGYSNWWPGSYGHGYYNGYYRGLHRGYYAHHNPYSWYNDRPVVIGKVNKVQYGPRDSRNTQVNGNVTGRPSRDGVYRGESTGESQGVVGRQSRSSRSTVSPASGTKQELPARPSRSSRSTVEPQQQNAQPENTRSNRRTREYVPSRSTEQPQQRREIRTRTIERQQPSRTIERSRPSRTIERSQPARIERSSPSRTIESRPSRTYESRPSSTPTPSIDRSSNSSSNSSSSSGSSGGGRPSRGNN